MTERERLIELLDHYIEELKPETLADYLIENGVIVPPCKVGDMIWLELELLRGGHELVESRCVKITIISDRQIVYSMHINDRAIGNTLEFYDDDLGKTVFLTREEAEKALKEREK